MDTNELTMDNGFSQKRLKRNKRRKKRLLFFKKLLFIILLAALLIFLALSPLFCINSIEVYGNKHYNSNELISASELIKGNNWFKSGKITLNKVLSFRSKESESAILKKCPYVKSVIVKLSLPWAVKITVEEREPVGIVSYMGTNLIIDKEGYLLDAPSDLKNFNVPFIKGLNFKEYTLGQVLQTGNTEWLEAFNKVLSVIRAEENELDVKDKRSLEKYIKYIDVSNVSKVCIGLDNRITVNFGHIEELDEYKISFLREIFFNTINEKYKGYLDFTAGDKPVLSKESDS